MRPPLHHFPTNEALAQQLAAEIASDLLDAIERRGSATLALSGGSTPVALFAALSRCDIPWAKVVVVPVDERWVDESHTDSNAGLIRRHLLRDAAADAQLQSLKTDAATPDLAVPALQEQLGYLWGELDVVVLGMGEDGHTASFFPGASALPRALDPGASDLVIAVDPPAAPHQRITLTLSCLLRAKKCYLHFVGAAKLAVFQRASEAGDVETLPVRCVLHSPGRELEIYYADEN